MPLRDHENARGVDLRLWVQVQDSFASKFAKEGGRATRLLKASASSRAADTSTAETWQYAKSIILCQEPTVIILENADGINDEDKSSKVPSLLRMDT